MRPNRLRELWSEGEPAAIGWMSTADGLIAETMAHAGFDVIVVDMQHGMGIGPDRAVATLQVLSTTDVMPMVRVPWNDPIPIQYVLDSGAYGVVVPMISNREDAVKAAGACRYAPMGYRSNGPTRSRLYFGEDYFEHANDEIICLAMIETEEGVNNLDEIAEVPGIDGFHIGPTDLAISLGLPPGYDLKEPRWVDAVQQDRRRGQASRPAGRHSVQRAGGSGSSLQAGVQLQPTGLRLQAGPSRLPGVGEGLQGRIRDRRRGLAGALATVGRAFKLVSMSRAMARGATNSGKVANCWAAQSPGW